MRYEPRDGGEIGKKWTTWTKDKALGWWLRLEEGARETEVLEMMTTSPLGREQT